MPNYDNDILGGKNYFPIKPGCRTMTVVFRGKSYITRGQIYSIKPAFHIGSLV